jgi:hypothetical protein
LPLIIRRVSPTDPKQLGQIKRSLGWIAAAGVGSVLFIVVLGRGLIWSR